MCCWMATLQILSKMRDRLRRRLFVFHARGSVLITTLLHLFLLVLPLLPLRSLRSLTLLALPPPCPLSLLNKTPLPEHGSPLRPPPLPFGLLPSLSHLPSVLNYPVCWSPFPSSHGRYAWPASRITASSPRRPCPPTTVPPNRVP